MDIVELKRLRAIIRAFVANVSENGHGLDDENTQDRYHELYKLVEQASGDPKFRSYVQPIPYWRVGPSSRQKLWREHAITILNSATQLLAYLDSVLEANEKPITINDQPQQVHVQIGDGVTITGDFVVASSIANSFNKVDSADIPNELKILLKDLAKEVGKMSEGLPKETAEQVARDLETITAEATSKSPRKQWLQLSIEDLKKAAADVGAIGEPVLKLATLIIALLRI